MAAPKKTTAAKTKAAPKKTTTKAKATTKAKVAPKKTVAPAKPKAPRVLETAPAPAAQGSWWGWLVAVLLGGAFIGSMAADLMWVDEFDEESSMVVIDDMTWMPVAGTPVSVVVLNDANCGSACDTSAALNSLRASVTPALKVSTIDVNSTKGQILIDQFDLVSVPQFFFEDDIADLEVPGPEGEELRFIDNLPAGLLTEKEGLYYIDGARVGFKPGKFITAPEFADLDTEPTLGSGPVRVVEFTDLQCPFCKRFYDQNKDLIDQYVADGTITYVVKDFPLSFHKEAYETIHKAVNCAQQEGGNDAYFAVKADIFANQSSFNGIGSAAAAQQVAGYATAAGVDIEACLADGSVIEAEILADIAEGSKYGVTGTPAVFVGTQILPGAVGPQVLGAAIEAEKNQ